MDDRRLATPEELKLPSQLVERIHQVLRLAGLPLAVENGEVGVYLDRDGTVDGPGQCVMLNWFAPRALINATDSMVNRDPVSQAAANHLATATVGSMETALAAILTAGGLIVAEHPQTHSLAVWAAPGDPLAVPAS